MKRSRSRWISDLHWVRTGQQSRSQKTQESLLNAAAVLFSEKGVDATSVADVAARAGSSVGAVYHHFRDKKALLYAIFDRMSEELRATTRDGVDPARWEGATISDILRGYLEFSLEVGRDRPVFKRAGQEASRGDPALREHLAQLRSELNEGLTELLLARRDEIGHPDPELAIGFVLDQLGSMLQTRLDEILMPTRLANRSDEEFVGEALRSACAYLQVDPGPGGRRNASLHRGRRRANPPREPRGRATRGSGHVRNAGPAGANARVSREAQASVQSRAGQLAQSEVSMIKRPALFLSLVLIAAIAGCGPFVLLPGGALEGPTVPIPASWSFTDDVGTVQLETLPADPYSVNIWLIALDENLYVHAGANRSTWVENIETDPNVRLRVNDAIYDLAASRVDAQAEFDRFSDAYEQKYGSRPRNENVDEAYLFRLGAR